MDDFIFKRATLDDVEFVADIITEAEKSMTGRNGLANLFDLSDNDFKKYVIDILNEEMDGCEFSLSNFILAFHKGEPVAGMGGWVEGFEGMPSSIIKSNLIGYYFPRENVIRSREKLEIVKDIQIPREMGTYQLEYAYVKKEYTGYFLFNDLDEMHIEYALSLTPKPKKIQGHVFANNKIVLKLHELQGFKVVKSYHSNNPLTKEYYPDDTVLLIEKEL